jgi:G3E family GTPase
MAETAVLINEFGEVGLDHLLVRHVSEDIVLLNSGCLCCTVRGDLVTAMRDLFLKRVRGDVPEFSRLVIETTGLADPAPIIHTLMTDPVIGARYRLDGIVATVDAVNGAAQLDRHAEAVKQAAVADRLVLTKCDIADPVAAEALKARLRQLNPAAPLVVAAHGGIEPARILDAGLFNAKSKTPDVERWLNEEAHAAAHAARHDHQHDHHHHHDVNRHDAHISSFVVTLDEPVEWARLATALELLVTTRGESLLRIKGIVNAKESDTPLVVHGVQHVFHPPVPLAAWPDDDRRTRIVFITRDLGKQGVEGVIRASCDLH